MADNEWPTDIIPMCAWFCPQCGIQVFNGACPSCGMVWQDALMTDNIGAPDSSEGEE